MHEIIQMQSNLDRKQHMPNILNEASTKDESRVEKNTYVFTSPVKLMEWAKQSKPGDVLSIGTGGHRMLLYATADKAGKTKIGFYDPNEPRRHEVLQTEADKLMDPLNIPFTKIHHSGENPVVMCIHITSANSNNPAIEIKSDNLNNGQQFKMLRIMLNIGHNQAALELLENNPDIINARDKYGWTALHYAARAGSSKIIEVLLT